MPLLHVFVSKGLLDAPGRRAVGERLAALLLEVERVPDSPTARAMSWIMWRELGPDEWIVPRGGDEQRCLIEVVAPVGLLDAAQKAQAIERLTGEMLTHFDPPNAIESRLRIWVIVRDVPDGSWGVAGFVAPSAVIASGLGAT